MPPDTSTPITIEALAPELRLMQKRGLGRIEQLELPELQRACVTVGTASSRREDVHAIERLLRAAAESLGRGQSKLSLEDTLGLSEGTALLSPKLRREAAAARYSLGTEHFRHYKEKELLHAAAKYIVDLCAESKPTATAVALTPTGAEPVEGVEIASSPDATGVITDNLPGSEGQLIGRKTDVDELMTILRKERLVLVKADGGRGKSAVVEEVGNKFAELPYPTRVFDFIFQKSAKSSSFTFSEFADDLGRFLGNRKVANARDLAAKKHLLTTELRGRRGLVIIDNAETIDDPATIGDIAKLPRNVTLMFTSRHVLPDLHPKVYRLKPLGDAASRELFGIQLERGGEQTLEDFDEEALKKMLELLGGNPLAIIWVVTRLIRSHPLESIYKRLTDGGGDLLDKLFSQHWDDLSVNARLVLQAAAVLGESVGVDVLSRVPTGPDGAGEEALADLLDMSLLDPVRLPGSPALRYAIHSLTRQFAIARTDSPAAKAEVEERAGAALLAHINDNNLMQNGRINYLGLDAELESALLHLDRLDDGIRVSSVGGDRDALMRRFVEFATSISVILWGRGYWAERVAMCERASAYAAELGNHDAASRHAATVGIVLLWQGRIEAAESWAERSKEVLGAPASNLQSAVYERLFALIHSKQKHDGHTRQAIDEMVRVLDVIDEARHTNVENQEAIRRFADWACAGPEGWRAGKVAVTQEIGIMYADLAAEGHFESEAEAVYWLQASADLAKTIGDVEGLSIALSHWGRAIVQGDPVAAESIFTEALKRALTVNRRSTEARAKLGLGEIALRDGRTDTGMALLADARKAFEQLGMTRELAACDRLTVTG